MGVTANLLIEQKRTIEKELKEISETAYKFATNKKIPLDDRFKVWDMCCEKKEHTYIYRAKQTKYPTLGIKLNNYYEDCQRYQTVTYNDIIDWCCEDEELTNLQEELIADNFGSCIMDW